MRTRAKEKLRFSGKYCLMANALGAGARLGAHFFMRKRI